MIEMVIPDLKPEYQNYVFDRTQIHSNELNYSKFSPRPLFGYFWRATMCWPLLRLCRHFVFLRDVRIQTQREAVTSRYSTKLTTYPLLIHPSPSLATHLSP